MSKRSNEEEIERKLKKIKRMEERILRYKDDINLTDQEHQEVRQSNPVKGEAVLDQDDEGLCTEEEEEGECKEQKVEQHHDLEDEDFELPQDILTALGEILQDESYAQAVRPNIINIIQNILIDGLPKEQRETIIKTSKIPVNAKLLDAPKLNIQLQGLISQSSKSRDDMLRERQQDLGVATGGICQVIHELTKPNFDKITIIKNLGESLRILANLHFQYTQIRRKLIVPYLDKILTENLKDNKRSEFLYSGLQELMKSTTEIKQAINVNIPKNVPKNHQNPRRQNQPVKTTANNPNLPCTSRDPAKMYIKPHYKTYIQEKPVYRPWNTSNRRDLAHSKYP